MMLDTLFMTLLISVTLGLLAWMLYRAKQQGFQRNTQETIKIIQCRNISRHHQLAVFHYRNQEYVVGLSANMVNVIEKVALDHPDNVVPKK